MRELKFRAWNTNTNDWHKTELPFYGFHIFGECTLVCPPKLEDLQHLVIEQFIEVQDENKIDIYEGDIMKWHNLTVLIRYEKGSLVAETLKSKVFAKWDDIEMQEPKGGIQDLTGKNIYFGKIIGNVHQNPDLLK